MSLHSRLLWLIVGAIFGLILGYIVRWVQESMDLRSTVKHTEKKNPNLVQNVGLFLVVAITVTAAVLSQHSSNRTSSGQNEIKKISTCTQIFTEKVIAALNARTTFSSDQAVANVNLQKAQVNFLTKISAKPPISKADGQAAFNSYISALSAFLTVQDKNAAAIQDNPFPTTKDFNSCIDAKEKT